MDDPYGVIGNTAHLSLGYKSQSLSQSRENTPDKVTGPRRATISQMGSRGDQRDHLYLTPCLFLAPTFMNPYL